MAISDLFNKLMGRGVLGNVGDTVVSMGKEAQEAISKNKLFNWASSPSKNSTTSSPVSKAPSPSSRVSKDYENVSEYDDFESQASNDSMMVIIIPVFLFYTRVKLTFLYRLLH